MGGKSSWNYEEYFSEIASWLMSFWYLFQSFFLPKREIWFLQFKTRLIGFSTKTLFWKNVLTYWNSWLLQNTNFFDCKIIFWLFSHNFDGFSSKISPESANAKQFSTSNHQKSKIFHCNKNNFTKSKSFKLLYNQVHTNSTEQFHLQMFNFDLQKHTKKWLWLWD